MLISFKIKFYKKFLQEHYQNVNCLDQDQDQQSGSKLGRVVQSVTCLTLDMCLTADPGVASSIPARSPTFEQIDHEIISTTILLPSSDSRMDVKVCAQSIGQRLSLACPGKSVVR